jgi:DNA-binding IscR family transcriptional regulator
MSFHLVNVAWEKDLPHAPKIVLLALAHFAHQSTGECFPSIRLLSARCGLSASSVRSQIRALEKAGIVETERQADGPVYRVKLGVAA